ncbi:MAG: hypothetical protein KDJ86_01945 [Bauldia sp.]|uniref:hypothetical protein n=1 Tax=Bauldia sp. TaxID=2575872 RepID=UPI001DA4AF40|nr:hypothetical protein [Bauldia sp.]MCB1494521.1 hypothetical protein [Bauldia sp.]
MAYWSARVILWLIAVCYGVFAFGHALNIFGMGGFDWANAPLSWQLIDVLYLAADLAVVYGFVLLRPIGFVAFLVAVVSQFVLYWAVAPGAGAADAAGSAFPGYFVPFHVATIALVLVAVFLLWRRDAREAA